MRSLFWGTVAVSAGLCVVAAMTLPERVPLHFGGGGEPDRWGSRTEAVVTMAGLTAGLALLLGLLATFVPRAPKEMVNLKERDKEWWFSTPERQAAFRRRLSTDLHAIGAATIAVVALVDVQVLLSAHRDQPRLGWVFWVVVGVYVVGVLAYCWWCTTTRYRTPQPVEE